jgi:hypothetical protein
MQRPPRVFAVTLLAFVATALFASCAASADQGKPGSATRIDEPTDILDRYTDVVDISDFYDFAATTLDGDRIDGSDYRGKQLALWFWAPW